ncbi:hypothetical protein Cni_G05418 [Canna indica]|uniref:PAP/OAS1 substrate-binding domain superfamily n=1 Tax=Canna indica TaxID=4628 RepID=A0AAQ3JV72_9LILI|nr:hypothetical protein Cni_G05418 [Canna indica]
MGDLQSWPPLANGDASGGHDSPRAQSQPPNPHPSMIKAENWRRAEEATRDVLLCIRPTVVSEERRKAVVDYVQNLLRTRIHSEVFPFGSVPLKTYLPDGDIDLTALGFPSIEDALANEVFSVLGEEEQSKDGEFEVKDVQIIRAEVKLVKCIVQNIVVDVSFNQIGGLCTLCFLEKVDQTIGKNNLFKRSIILIKAWCYYESRILGAHHGLISTYALEILVLYVFHLFHNYLDGPLAVLYMFLDYYSRFDWEKYCISLQGPVSISSLPNIVVEPPETSESSSPLTEEFIRECVEMFSVPSRVYGNNYPVFTQKHLNIVDPLKQNNNLGRSVSKGNFFRIRSAFTYGARKLARILLLPSECIAEEVNLFFKSTLDRHGSRERPDVQEVVSSCPNGETIYHNGIESTLSKLNSENGTKASNLPVLPASDSNGVLNDEINNIKISELDLEPTYKKQHDIHSSSRDINAKCPNNWSSVRSILPVEDIPVKHLVDDAIDISSTNTYDSRTSDESFKASTSGKAYHAPHLYFPLGSVGEDETIDNLSSGDNEMVGVFPSRSTTSCEEIRYETKAPSSTALSRKFTLTVPADSGYESLSSSWNCYPSEDLSLAECSNGGNLNTLSPSSSDLSSLSGDYNLYFNNLRNAQGFQEYILNPYVVQTYQASSQFPNKHSWNMRNMYSHVGANGLVHMPQFPPSYYVMPPVISNGYGAKDITKRGTGTYLPNTNSRSYKERQLTGRGKNQMPINQLPRYRRNGHGDTLHHGGSSEERNHGSSPLPQAPSFVGNGHEKPLPLDVPQSPHPTFVVVTPGNGFSYPSEGKLEFGSLGPVPVGVSSPGRGSNSESGNAVGQGSGSTVPAPAVERSYRSLNHERINQPYQLKDDGDFPPLAG